MGVVYLIQNKVNGKLYVGLDRTNSQARWKEHIRRSKKPTQSQLIDRKLKEYGLGNFEYSELFQANDLDLLKQKEQNLITILGSLVGNGKGYNLTAGGDGCVDFKMPVSSIHKGPNHYMFGKKQTEESNRKRSEAMKIVRASTINPFTLLSVRRILSDLAKKRIGPLNTNYKHGKRMGLKRIR